MAKMMAMIANNRKAFQSFVPPGAFVVAAVLATAIVFLSGCNFSGVEESEMKPNERIAREFPGDEGIENHSALTEETENGLLYRRVEEQRAEGPHEEGQHVIEHHTEERYAEEHHTERQAIERHHAEELDTNEQGREVQDTKELNMDQQAVKARGMALFYSHCASCHSPPGSGMKAQYAEMDDAKDRYSREFLMDIMRNGRAVMPSFLHLTEEEKEAIVEYLFHVDEDGEVDTGEFGPDDDEVEQQQNDDDKPE